ncbi:putative f-box wd repeat-containing protein 1a protein [Phaeoacremonium minimum UCRPA7]|uniref:Putative f-box wd repeat-containing protein 1a protein n=1 Tax=Phaeoacremonium minimum (strain UCR-PA7) TaxID=1286976 RepID=R8B9T7_PHAM7|nr:putative f-box wd repeat-containing protein 1a protein [Phaeoacremonium minimum UCRPA7]EON96070.1 putative f-box wd repeat-containing protein 1a protein [Phaeoacremonium minimum UCRPA7]
MALLDELPTSVIAEIVIQLNPRLYIDFIRHLPAEICLKILGYLDPVSLIHVAQTCRAWYDLALDRKLWEKLYYLEGWKAVTSEIQAWEEKVNDGLNLSAQGQLQRVTSSEDGHVFKKRAISLSPRMDNDRDYIMSDLDRPLRQEPRDVEMGEGSSIFGGPGNMTRSSMTPAMGNLDMGGSGSSWSSAKGKSIDKGKGKALSPPLNPTFVKEDSLPEMVPSELPAGLPKSTLWMWDSASGRYKINWKYLYTLRRRLESNWELGKFKNFQLPHPDHPEEGHNNECIYSLQYNSEYLVSGSRDRTLRIWNLQTRRLVRDPLVGHNGSVLCLQFDSDPDENLIVSGSSDSDVILWEFSTGRLIQRLRKAHRESVLNVKFDKRILVTCSKDKSIKIFNRRPLRPGDPGYGDLPVNPVPVHLKNYGYDLPSALDQLPIKPAYTMIGSLEGHGAAVNAVQIVDKEVVSASGDRSIKVWDWQSGICRRTFLGHGKGIACVQYDGKRIVSGSSDNEVKVFCRQSGVEVASLRSHSDLVRTVQAGFGDLPYSAEEDAAEAKKVDEAYFKALEEGKVSSTPQRGRPGNAGSRRPEDITAYGARLPPGGGGGRYGRIVSGSYDKSIIIWRRDKEGIWKPQHHLKQEEAATAAQRHNAPGSIIPLHPSVRPAAPGTNPGTGSPTATSAAPAAPTAGPSAIMPVAPVVPGPSTIPAIPHFTHPNQIVQIEEPIIATMTPSSQQSYAQLIDLIVPQGVHALQQALASYPTMLTLHSHLQAAIDREPSTFVRSQLRQAVSTALVRTQLAHARARQVGLQQAAMGSINPAGPATMGESSASGAQQAQAGQQPLVATGTTGNASAHASAQAETSAGPAGGQLIAQADPVASASGAPPTIPAAAAATAAAPHHNAAAPAQPHGAGQAAAAQHHPHIAGAGATDAANPARVYKLQFDARRIICCSQTSVIVGWDFCNGDPELEEAAKFFATVD